jgi:uncharacterized protein (DUF58 family)
MMTVASLLLAVLPLAWLWNRHSTRRIEYGRTFSEHRAFAGETIDLSLRVTNRKLLPVPWLKVQDEFPARLNVVDGTIESTVDPTINHLASVLSLRWYERVTWHYRVHCDKRGYYPVGPVHMQSGDLFGFFTNRVVQPLVDWLIVYPRVQPITTLALPPKEPIGEAKADQRVFEDPIRTVGIRDYQPQDAFKRIHWKATARRQQLQVRVHEPTTTHQLVVFPNIATLPRHYQGILPALLERIISLTASIAAYAVDRRYLVGILTNGCWPFSDQPLKVLPSRDPAQLMHILEALAAIGSMPTCEIVDLLLSESPNLPWGATLVVVSAVITEEFLATLIRLHDAGRRVVLVTLNESEPSGQVPGVLTYRVAHEGPMDFKLVGGEDS